METRDHTITNEPRDDPRRLSGLRRRPDRVAQSLALCALQFSLCEGCEGGEG